MRAEVARLRSDSPTAPEQISAAKERALPMLPWILSVMGAEWWIDLPGFPAFMIDATGLLAELGIEPETAAQLGAVAVDLDWQQQAHVIHNAEAPEDTFWVDHQDTLRRVADIPLTERTSIEQGIIAQFVSALSFSKSSSEALPGISGARRDELALLLLRAVTGGAVPVDELPEHRRTHTELMPLVQWGFGEDTRAYRPAILALLEAAPTDLPTDARSRDRYLDVWVELVHAVMAVDPLLTDKDKDKDRTDSGRRKRDRDEVLAELAALAIRVPRTTPARRAGLVDRSIRKLRAFVPNVKRDPVFHGTGPLYLGLELELNVPRGRVLALAGLVVDALGELGYVTHDVTIDSGFEIVTHPLAYPWALADFPWTVLPELQRAGADTHAAGLHVHISRAAFDSPAHVYHWMLFVYRNAEQVIKLARRSSEAWAPFTAEDQARLADYAAGARGESRNRAINTSNDHTFELRVFASSLRPDEVRAALGFAAASVHYTRTLAVASDAADWASFVNWVNEHPEYAPLARELQQRAPGRSGERTNPRRKGPTALAAVGVPALGAHGGLLGSVGDVPGTLAALGLGAAAGFVAVLAVRWIIRALTGARANRAPPRVARAVARVGSNAEAKGRARLGEQRAALAARPPPLRRWSPLWWRRTTAGPATTTGPAAS
jgi:hypothetical protein